MSGTADDADENTWPGKSSRPILLLPSRAARSSAVAARPRLTGLTTIPLSMPSRTYPKYLERKVEPEARGLLIRADARGVVPLDVEAMGKLDVAVRELVDGVLADAPEALRVHEAEDGRPFGFGELESVLRSAPHVRLLDDTECRAP